MFELFLLAFQDIQAEIDAHNDIFKSIDGNRQKMVKALGNSEEAALLQHRLDDMNQRWNDLKAKSANIRWVMKISRCDGAQFLSSKRLDKYDHSIEIKYLFSFMKDPWVQK